MPPRKPAPGTKGIMLSAKELDCLQRLGKTMAYLAKRRKVNGTLMWKDPTILSILVVAADPDGDYNAAEAAANLSPRALKAVRGLIAAAIINPYGGRQGHYTVPASRTDWWSKVSQAEGRKLRRRRAQSRPTS